MTRRAALLVIALLISPVLHAGSVEDLTGKWNGTFVITMDGQTQNDVVFMNLTQKGNILTGTVGPTLELQWTIASGKVDGTKVTLDVAPGEGPSVTLTLTLVDGRLKGDAVAEQGGMKMTAKVDAGRSK